MGKFKNDKEFMKALSHSQFSGPVVFGPPIYPQHSSEYPAIIRSDEKLAIVAVDRETGYLMVRVVRRNCVMIAKTELQPLADLEKNFPLVCNKQRWALKEIGQKPSPPPWEK